MKKFVTFLFAMIMGVTLFCLLTSCVSKKQKEALAKAKSYVDTLAVSKQRVVDGLEQLGYSDKEIDYALENCGADWFQEAVEAAENAYQLDPSFYNEENLTSLLMTVGFTYEEAVYGARQALS